MERTLVTPSSDDRPTIDSSDDRFVYDIDAEESPSQAVVVAVAAASGLDALAVADEFGPLYDAIDPSALDALFEAAGDRDRAGGTVTFSYANRTVTVESGDRIVLEAE